MLVVAAEAPRWAHDLARQIDRQSAEAKLGLFVSFAVYDAAGELPDPAKNANKFVLLSNGSFWLAKSSGAAWLYPDNTPV